MDTGRIVSEQAVYSFAVGSATQLTAVFGNMEGQMLAAFKNGRNGQIIQSGYTDGAVIVPDTPFVMGYTSPAGSETAYRRNLRQGTE